MRSHPDLLALALAGLLAAGASAAAQRSRALPTPPIASPTEPEVAAAVERLKQDPNLAATRKVRTLKWVRDTPSPKEKPSRDLPGWLKWIGEFFNWLAGASRALVWIAAAILAALLTVFIVRKVRGAGGRFERREAFVAPTHVRDLDIRPQSLPADIGAAALALWERGEHRAALSLLYRGLLSRLAHAHRVPIRDSSTESDCLALARKQLHADRTAYISRLIRTWQQAVYGGRQPETTEVGELCAGFADALDAAPAPVLAGKAA